MGITDLLKLYKPLIKCMDISELKGYCAGIDIMMWLYRGVYAALNNSTQEDYAKCDLYLNFPLKMLLLLKEKGIQCIAVFDGNNNEAKNSELQSRMDQKNSNLQLAQSLAKEGKEEESKKIMKRTLKIKRRMINTLIDLLKKLDIPVIVAPYEADSQLAFLYKHNLIDFAISEDSDLIPYGIERIAFKLDSYGNMSYLEISKAKQNLFSIDNDCNWLLSIPHHHLVAFCVMLGCDYLSSIKGFGCKSGLKLFKSSNDIEQIIRRMQCTGKYSIEPDYIDKIKKAIGVFYMQTVYDPKTNQLVPLNDLSIYDENDTVDEIKVRAELYDIYQNDKNYFGAFFDDSENYCKGNLDVKTREKDRKVEKNDIIEKYYQRYANVMKWSYDVKVIPFEKKEKYITLSNAKPQKKSEEEVIDIKKEIEYLTNEMNHTENHNAGSLQYMNENDSNVKTFLNRKRNKSNDTESKPIIEEEEFSLALEERIKYEMTRCTNMQLIPNNTSDDCQANQANCDKYPTQKWKISNNAKVKQSQNAFIIDDICHSRHENVEDGKKHKQKEGNSNVIRLSNFTMLKQPKAKKTDKTESWIEEEEDTLEAKERKRMEELNKLKDLETREKEKETLQKKIEVKPTKDEEENERLTQKIKDLTNTYLTRGYLTITEVVELNTTEEKLKKNTPD